jgi:hypothetical protein
MKTRIYIVDSKDSAARLIRAANKVQARNHAARDTFTVGLASQDDLIMALGAGVKVENANVEDEE